MAKSPYGKPASDKDKKKFAHYLAEDEEMLLLTGVSFNYLFQKFTFYLSIAILGSLIAAVVIIYLLKTDPTLTLVTTTILSILFASAKVYFLKEGIQYILTTKRLIVQIGYFSVTLYSTPYNKITFVEVDQSFMERLFLKYGRMIVHTAGANSKNITLDFLAYPFEFKNTLERLIHEEKRYLNYTG